MKDKVIVFIIGLLVGAILATGGFCIYENIKSSQREQSMNSRDFKGQMSNGENFKNGQPEDMKNIDKNSDSRPSRPNSSDSKSNNSTNTSSTDQNTPPEKPADDSKPVEENKTTESNNNQ